MAMVDWTDYTVDELNERLTVESDRGDWEAVAQIRAELRTRGEL